MRRYQYVIHRGAEAWQVDPPWHWIVSAPSPARRRTACGRLITQVMEDSRSTVQPQTNGPVCPDCVLALAGLDNRRDVP
jgi:hypothetical protein